MNRRQAREKALQSLFQIDVSQTPMDEAIFNAVGKEKGLQEELDPFLKQLVYGTCEKQEEIDQMLMNHLEQWSLERLANVDRSILRLALYEMQYVADVPLKVTLNEAIELAKTFGSDESGRFVNGVLSKIIEKENIHKK